MEEVILVDEHDNVIGKMEKMEAHQKGVLHRAFSILIFNSKGELLLQKRANSKYHSGGLWTNTCCSHPQPGETLEAATRRKLKQEMGIDPELEFLYKFIYRVPFSNGLIEYELDHVFIGTYDGVPAINSNEVEDWRIVTLSALKKEMNEHPDRYTPWFRLMMSHPELEQRTAR